MVSDMDIGGINDLVLPLTESIPTDILTKLSYFTPMNMYTILDEFSRDSLFYLANDLGWGLGLSIAIASLGIKMFFMPLMAATQLNATKLKLLEPEMKNFQSTTQRLQKMGDYAGMREAQRQFQLLRKKYGVNTWVTLASFFQIPVLITWFLSLRYVSSSPDKYPGLTTEGLLWFQDLSQMDPYYILPTLSAIFSYYNISLNPNMSGATSFTKMGKYLKYMKYVPFLSMPVVVFFPSSLTLYWALTAFTHLCLALFVRNPKIRQYLGVPEYLPGSILEQMANQNVQQIIKTVIMDVPKKSPIYATAAQAAAAASLSAASAASAVSSSFPVQNNSSNPKQSSEIHDKKPEQIETPKKQSGLQIDLQSNEAPVQIFTTKPKKKKN